MSEHIVAIDVQEFLGNNNKFILKEVGVEFKNETILNSNFIIHSPHDFIELNKTVEKQLLG